MNNSILAYKYILSNDGIVFVTPNDIDIKLFKDRLVEVFNDNKNIYLKYGNIYALLNESIINHLSMLLNKTNIIISLSSSKLEDYEIKTIWSITLDQVNCATLISLFKIAKTKIQI
ncbi:MAG: hypothetical protein HQK79_21970 [Desulfobacterales bacterium]|nr:hypothetical protein [Desulfobacterales bacterium]